MSIPAKLAPLTPKCQVPEQVLSWQLSQALADRELEFLEGYWLSIHARDIDPKWYTSAENDKLIASQSADADVGFSTNASDLLMIAAHKQDLDTLFFQRRLVIEGDIESGLYIKNPTGVIELEQMSKALRVMLMRLADLVGMEMRTSPGTKQTSVGEPC